MMTIWTFGRLAVTAEEIDFVDPAEVGPDVRERGLRLELRVVHPGVPGSIYASPGWVVDAPVCRFDLLESRPGARDRMHWHPAMSAGEPGDRTFDRALAADPVGWLRARLSHAEALLDDDDLRPDAAELRAGVDVVLRWVEQGLERMAAPWPDAVHDERGLALPR
jgi:hypothetical protein